MASQQQALVLYRQMLHTARKMPDYNFRSYALRRVKLGFHQNRQLQGDDTAAAIQEGLKQLEVLKRQALLGQLYPSTKSVME